jgi:DNA-binding PadR family transcriptional regulator
MGRLQLTYSTAAVLNALGNGPRYGFDIISATGLPSGTIYPMLRRLQRNGIVTSRWEEAADAHRRQRPQRKYYTLTTKGEAALADALQRFPALAGAALPDGVPDPR